MNEMWAGTESEWEARANTDIKCEQPLQCPEVQREELNACNQPKKWESGSLAFSVALFKQLHNKPLHVITAVTNFYIYMHMNRLSESSYWTLTQPISLRRQVLSCLFSMSLVIQLVPLPLLQLSFPHNLYNALGFNILQSLMTTASHLWILKGSCFQQKIKGWTLTSNSGHA